jgi:hypothetical protein
VLLGRPQPAAGEPWFLPEDTNWALAHAAYKAQVEANRCRLCGLPKEICRDPANQFAFEVDVERCHATYAMAAAQERAQGKNSNNVSMRSTTWAARLKQETASSAP